MLGGMDDLRAISYFGRTTFREGKAFGIRQADRRHHMYAIGKTGTGKTTLLETLVNQDVIAGRGLALLDPHGDLIDRVRNQIPDWRRRDLIDFDVPGSAAPVAFNPLDPVPADKRSLAASSLLESFKKLWPDSWGPRLEYILRNALFALVHQPEATLADILRLLEDKSYRHAAMTCVDNERLRDFWLREFEQYSKSFRTEAIAPVQNKIGAFLADPRLQNILLHPKSAFDMRQVMDDGKILLVNLAKGRIGQDSAALLGSLIVSRMELAALSRADIPEASRRDFQVYLDEFQLFATLSLADMMAELRKYRLNLTLAHQYLGQLDREIRDAVLGNVGTVVSFRVGAQDAVPLGREFEPEFSGADLVGLANRHVVVRLMIDGAPSKAFSAETIR